MSSTRGWAGVRPVHREPDRGAASLWLLAAGFLVLSVGILGAASGAATVARHRAQVAADFGALAGAARAVEGAESGCARAAELVAANAGRLVDCRLIGLDAVVTVEVRVTGVPGLHAAARATARAGPVVSGQVVAEGPSRRPKRDG
ncbi:MAG TPA: Rv3654c family TadE-like protein [Micromonosporaceae bacterium]|jgi:secretion/DNA translocation related TadE-like protein|nr:Rv3654c family TadE-like protein [Micromonosporaceae bacterium]